MLEEQNKEDAGGRNLEPETEARVRNLEAQRRHWEMNPYTPAATVFFTSAWYSNAPV